MFKSSLKELKSIKVVVLCGLLIAIAAAIEAINPLNLGDIVKIRFDFVAIGVMGYIAGPIGGAFAAAVGDIVRYLAKPLGPFFPGYTISAFCGGFIYGYFLYKIKKPLIKSKWGDLLLRCSLAKLSINVFVNIILNTIWMTMTQGKAFMAILPLRVAKNLIALPIEIAVLFLVMVYVTKFYENKKLKV